MEEKGRFTFKERQESYRASVCAFFQDARRYHRLSRIVFEGDRLCPIIFFYVKEFECERFVRTSEGIFRLCDEYRNAISNHKKRYYNFESKEGCGELVWEGLVNPRVLVNEQLGSIALPLPRLVALQWFIQFDFDLLFWERYDEVHAAYVAHVSQVKRRYTDTHKEKKREKRKRLEEEVIAQRSGVSNKSVYLTRAERNLISRRLEQERRDAREQKRRLREDGKRLKRRGHAVRTKGLGVAVQVECNLAENSSSSSTQ